MLEAELHNLRQSIQATSTRQSSLRGSKMVDLSSPK
jgi:hypothetical protein